MLVKSVLSLLSVLVISSSALATVSCLSEKSEADITIQLKKNKTTDYAYLYDGNVGQSEEILGGQTQEFSAKRFYFIGAAGDKRVVLEIDLESVQVDNGLLTIAGKPQRVRCYTSQIPLID